MLRYALRRALWTLAGVVFTSLVLFALLAHLPHARPNANAGPQRDLPVFVNLNPRDVRALAAQAVDGIVFGFDREASTALLQRLGGAALPYVLPQLDALGPVARGRVAMALEPVAVRMGLTAPNSFRTTADAVAFWTRFWEERSVDFKPAVVRRAVRRLASQGSDARRAELIELDTFALGGIMSSLEPVRTPDDVSRSARLVGVASHVTGREACVKPSMPVADADRCVTRWREWWLVAHADYQVSAGPERVAAMLTETRYGLWALQALTLRLGVEPDGVSVLDRLAREAPRTGLIAGLALLLAYLVAIPIGLLAAARRSAMERATTAVVVILFALPAPLIATALALHGGLRFAIASAFAAAAVGLVGAPSRQQRIAALTVLAEDPVRLAKAAGVRPGRILFLHVARSTAAVAATTLPLDFPMALSAACVVEHVFHINGIGEDLVRAAIDRDVSMLMAFGIIATAANGIVLLASEVVAAWLDPRIRRALLREVT